MSGSSSDVATAVAQLLDAATATDATSLDGILASMERARGRRIIVEDVDDLPAGVCGRWGRSPTQDVLQLRRGVLSRSWTLAHELGHMVLGHSGVPVVETMAAELSAAGLPLIEYMLNRTPHGDDDTDRRQEAEAEAFAGLLTARLRQVSRSRSPGVQARLTDTLG